ncbi:baseplate J/gp47 family protein [Candidatus Sodalis endolongispinus]|uniref:Baseplate J/gp47 family protein n=1 Tax=Candidatus Sodalis endolongispinus TaxID=2812662 RepID=A0ABS5Y8M2_9GAMM|nr:baseplate J/gp47 family protein [Candidatus Sodalis endolongispinus]MBT9431349.1 baseplate J/gp47 family protein [Candidatus Sodalis endolongispinus]
MAHSTPTHTEIADTLLRDICNQLPDADTGPDSDYAVRANAIASALQGLYQHQLWIVRQMFPDTADHDYLVMHARTRNLTPKAATPAGGEVRLTGNPGAKITGLLQLRPTGQRQRYQTTAPGTIDATGSLTLPARALENGTQGNLADNTPGTLLMAPAGVDSDVTITRMVGGSEAESDAALLARLLEVIRRPPAGGNQYDYHRWAVSLPGVTEAYVYPLRRGYGTVDVVIVTHNDLPSPETIKSVQSYIDEMRPVTAKDCLVLAPVVVKADITVQVSLNNLTLDAARKQITSALSDYFNRLAPGEVAVRTQLGALISEVVGVVDYQLLAPSANVVPVVNKQTVQWIRAGTITVETMP